MRKISVAVIAVALVSLFTVSGCAVYHDRYGTAVAFEPEFWGTVTYVDPGSGIIALDYVGDGGRHFTRRVYYGADARWDGVRDAELHSGDRIWVRGRSTGRRYQVESVRRHD
ncbi:MAG TPA: hypothetical protein VLC46_13995 [Thermoanaerobaculia bacterium]|jgi:hypothetical protein|nr:hypothetical protein [Thermoanaerobaculia bacterium]